MIRQATLILMLVSILIPLSAQGAIIQGSESALKMYVRFEQDETGVPVAFHVAVQNTSSEDVKMEFRSSLQIDYVIDDEYRYSSNHGFTDALTYAEIQANSSKIWEFKHTSEDFKLDPGIHYLRFELVDTNIIAEEKIYIPYIIPELPEGITLVTAVPEKIFDPGEAIPFEVTATNTTESDITLAIHESMPLKYRISRTIEGPIFEPKPDDPGTVIINDGRIDSFIPETSDVVIPAGETLSWKGTVGENIFFLGGEYHLFAGLRNYTNEAECTFTISDKIIYGTITGTVRTYAEDTRTILPLEGATITLKKMNMDYYLSSRMIDAYPDVPGVTTTSDANGEFRFDDVQVGTHYSIEVAKEGYVTYYQWVRIYSTEVAVEAFMKREQPHTENPLNFVTQRIGGLEVYMGTGRYIFEPDGYLKGYMRISNISGEAITFNFDTENFVTWTLSDTEGNEIWRREGTWEDSTVNRDLKNSDNTLTLGARETTEFYCVTEIREMLPYNPKEAKYQFGATFNFTSSSDTSLNPGDINPSVTIAVVESSNEQVRIDTDSVEYVVDLKDSVKTVVNMKMRTPGVSGEMNVTELKQNIHAPLSNHRFIKMVEIDADQLIADDLDEALVRIYYDEEDAVDPEKLVIAHWKDSGAFKSTAWTVLESTVNTEERYVEAYTDGFSSFGLFETDNTVDVSETQPETFSLAQNSPNPFNPSTTINFTVPNSGAALLVVYNMAGQEVARLVDGNLSAGTHQAVFDGSGLASGVYFYRITAGNHTATRRMLMIK